MVKPQELTSWQRPVVWDINQERIYLENLLNQRFNFFLVIFVLILGGSASANSQPKLILLLSFGLALCLLMWATVYRVYVKLDIVLKMCYDHEGHFLKEIAIRTNKRGIKGLFSVNSLIGIYIPLMCLLMIVVALLLSFTGVIKAS